LIHSSQWHSCRVIEIYRTAFTNLLNGPLDALYTNQIVFLPSTRKQKRGTAEASKKMQNANKRQEETEKRVLMGTARMT